MAKPNTQIQPLNSSIIKKINTLNKQIQDLETTILDRINYIAKKVCEAFGEEFSSVNLQSLEDGDLINLSYNGIDWYIHITDDDAVGKKRGKTKCLSGHDFAIVLKDNSEWGLNELPTRWLFEDFEKELFDGVLLYKNKISKDAASKETKEEIINRAKAKLTKEELNAIGLEP